SFFQKEGIISADATVASVYHPSLIPLPSEVYTAQKLRLWMEASSVVTQTIQGKFSFKSVQVLDSPSPQSEDHIGLISKFAEKNDFDFLVTGSNDRSGLPYWFLGSFSEAALMLATLPLLIIKPYFRSLKFSKKPKLVIGVDVGTPPKQ